MHSFLIEFKKKLFYKHKYELSNGFRLKQDSEPWKAVNNDLSISYKRSLRF